MYNIKYTNSLILVILSTVRPKYEYFLLSLQIAYVCVVFIICNQQW